MTLALQDRYMHKVAIFRNLHLVMSVTFCVVENSYKISKENKVFRVIFVQSCCTTFYCLKQGTHF